ncbi:MAG: BON domain-containing protein [Nitrososphaerota archaeon]
MGGMHMADDNETAALAQQIQRRLRETVSDDITVGTSENAIYLSGRVADEAQRQMAEEVARALAGGMGVENDLVVERLLPEDRIETRSPDLGEAALYTHVTGPEENVGAINPEFSGQPLETNTAADAGVKDNPPVEPDPTYFAPTDPVVTTDQSGDLEVLGGFAPSSMEGMDVARSAEDKQPGDEALADAVRQALAEDAATTALTLDVRVEQGVVYLQGAVPDLVDAENAESVAAEVPGIRDVIDETTIEHM